MNALDKIKEKLEKLKKPYDPDAPKEFNSNTWKPIKGKNHIRLLPNFRLSPDQEERPFVPLYFYYEFGKTWLAPSQFNKPDPVHEMYKKMYKDSDPEVKELAKKLNSKIRISAPVLVRGKESEGVKFWFFSLTTYRKLEALYDDPQWGNISHLDTGVDLMIEYLPDDKDIKQSKTEIVPNRKSTPATTDSALLEAIQNMIDVTTIYPEPTETELRDALEVYLGVASKKEEAKQPETTTTTEPTADFDPKAFKPAEGPKPEKSKEVDDVEAEFEKILKGEK